MHPCTRYPVLKLFLHPNIVWRGEGRASRGTQVVREVHIMLHLNIWYVKDVESRFSITVPRIFVLHCLNNIQGGIYEIWKEFHIQKLRDRYSLFPFLEV